MFSGFDMINGKLRRWDGVKGSKRENQCRARWAGMLYTCLNHWYIVFMNMTGDKHEVRLSRSR
jgi:hypothetical protein